MEKPIDTEQVFSPQGYRVAVRYYYEDGSTRTISLEERKKEAVDLAKKIAKQIEDQYKK